MLDIRKAFSLASARANIRWPHGTNDADELADVLRGAIADMQAEQPTAENLLAKFVAWRDRAQQEGDAGCNYLNGDLESDHNGWDDIDDLAEQARSVLAKAGAL